MINWNEKSTKELLEMIFKEDSPSGFTHNLINKIDKYLKSLGYNGEILNKGAYSLLVKGKNSSKTIGISAHIDTLGLMVRSIKNDGTLNLTKIGGPLVPTLDGEYAKLYTRNNKIYEGTILCQNCSVHVYENASTTLRDIDNMIFRIDERVLSEKDVKDLGIQNGDFVCYDPKFKLTESGFLKSRFIDDKASAFIILYLLKEIKEKNLSFEFDTYILFSNFEEVGHGASFIKQNVSEFLAIDMGCVGKDLSGNEYAVSICAKDSSGPYDYELTTRLVNLAQKMNLNYTIDIFPMYGSDVGALIRSGHDIKGALVGTGVHASHGMERTHIDGINNTYKLVKAYLLGNDYEE